jgi:hypothetical protein
MGSGGDERLEGAKDSEWSGGLLKSRSGRSKQIPSLIIHYAHVPQHGPASSTRIAALNQEEIARPGIDRSIDR